MLSSITDRCYMPEMSSLSANFFSGFFWENIFHIWLEVSAARLKLNTVTFGAVYFFRSEILDNILSQ